MTAICRCLPVCTVITDHYVCAPITVAVCHAQIADTSDPKQARKSSTASGAMLYTNAHKIAVLDAKDKPVLSLTAATEEDKNVWLACLHEVGCAVVVKK